MVPARLLGRSVQQLGDRGHLTVASVLCLSLPQLANAGGD
jgi:hypothetical protein